MYTHHFSHIVLLIREHYVVPTTCLSAACHFMSGALRKAAPGPTRPLWAWWAALLAHTRTAAQSARAYCQVQPSPPLHASSIWAPVLRQLLHVLSGANGWAQLTMLKTFSARLSSLCLIQTQTD